MRLTNNINTESGCGETVRVVMRDDIGRVIIHGPKKSEGFHDRICIMVNDDDSLSIRYNDKEVKQ